jgi:hypothetical protein
MSSGLTLKVLWHDTDAIELATSASNGRFSGFAKPYVGIDSLGELADKLQGFPLDPGDERELRFGAFGKEFAGGSVLLRFFCAGLAGHAVVELRFEDEAGKNSGAEWNRPEQTATFFGWTEAFAIDEFVTELRRVGTNLSGEARLRFHERGF